MYAAIAQSSTILVELVEAHSSIYKIMSTAIESDNRAPQQLYEYQHLRCLSLFSNDYYFILIWDKSIPVRLATAYLNHLKKDFLERFVYGSETLKPSHYAKWMQSTLSYYMENNNADKLRQVLADVQETTSIMEQNVIKLHERGAKLSALQDDTSILADNAQDWHKETKDLKCNKCLEYYFCCFASCCICCYR